MIIWLIVGGVAGWLAGGVMKGGGFGLIGDVVLGIVGAFVDGLLLPAVGIAIAAIVVVIFLICAGPVASLPMLIHHDQRHGRISFTSFSHGGFTEGAHSDAEPRAAAAIYAIRSDPLVGRMPGFTESLRWRTL